MKATDIRIVADRELLITWETGERSLYAAPYLQLFCRCAKCVDEHTGQVLIKDTDVDTNAIIRDVLPVGNYAVRFLWSKGCQSGIYSFDHLYAVRPKQ